MQSELVKKLTDDVARHGWHCMQVMEDSSGPGYSFTVGFFQTYKHPELMIMGLPADVSHQILGLASEQIGKGHVYRAGSLDDTLLEGKDCKLQSIPEAAYRKYLGLAQWFYRESKSSFPALQILWPDENGKYPGQEGFSLAALQPVI